MASRARPLSPHLQVYKIQLTSTLSIMHRMTGILLCFGAVLMTVGLLAVVSGPQDFARFAGFLQSIIGRLLTAAMVISLVYHLCNGIRHLGWDSGYGLEIKQTYATGWTVVLLTLLVSALVLWCVWT